MLRNESQANETPSRSSSPSLGPLRPTTVQGIARLVTLAVSGDSEEQLEEDKEREAAFAPDRNPIEISLSRRNVSLAVRRVFAPVLAKHTKSFNLIDTLSVGVDRIQRNFEPLQRQVETWRQTQITDDAAKLILYSAFIDGKLEAPRSLLPEVHRLYFEPQYPEFSARTMWSLSNAFTSAFKKLDPVPQFKATAKLGGFLAQLPA